MYIAPDFQFGENCLKRLMQEEQRPPKGALILLFSLRGRKKDVRRNVKALLWPRQFKCGAQSPSRVNDAPWKGTR